MVSLQLIHGCAGHHIPDAEATSYAAAAGAVVAGAALWAVGGGCRMQGCPYGSHCNQKTGYCDVTKCSEGCPDGTVCNEGLDRCQAAPPPTTPNDFLPQDDARNGPLQH